MFLKTLEIQGFKSFPEKIRLEFNKGITAVVGPNGSGKSNISDAVRWVLGEQSAKTLRGMKMEDIIFAGTANRRALSFAEVSLIMDNTDYKVNIDYSEIAITRRVYRSGESEYLINGSVCRLKDIYELFMDTGIGKDGYSIIGQGKIDEILSTRSEDRRMLFEEAAGIIKFKNRRNEAQAKLERERQNLVRVNDIIAEIEKQTGPLKDQSEKAKTYVKLMERLKLIHINLFLNDVEEFQTEMSTLDERISISENHIQDIINLLNKYKNDYTSEKENLQNLEQSIDVSNKDLIEKNNLIQSKEHKIKIIEQNTEHLKSTIKRILNDIEQKKASIQSKTNDESLYKTKSNSLQMELASLQSDINTHLSVFEKLDQKLSDNEQLIEKYNADILQNMQHISEISNNMNRTNFIEEQLQKRILELDQELSYSDSQSYDKTIEIKALTLQSDNVHTEKTTIEQSLENEKNISVALQSEINELEENERLQIKQLNEMNSKYKILNELKDTYEGYYKSVKVVLKQNFDGVYGAVGELISVPENYEIATQIALGQSVQNIVTEDEKAAQKAIEYLKRTNSGRATFLPMTAMQARSKVESDILKENGVIGTLKDLIYYDQRFESVISSLCERVIVIDNLDNATDFVKKYKFAYKTVTLEGEIFNIGGSLTGGSILQKSGNIFSRERELKTLKDMLKNIDVDYNNTKSLLVKKYSEKESSYKKVEHFNSMLQEKSQHLDHITNQINQQQYNLNELEEKRKTMLCERDDLKQQFDTIKAEIEDYKKKKEHYEQEEKRIREALEYNQRSIQEDKEIKDNKMQALTNLRISMAEINQQIQSNNEHIDHIKRDIKHLEEEISIYRSEVDSSEKEIQSNDLEIESIKKQIQDLTKDIEVLKGEIVVQLDKKQSTQNNISYIEKTIENNTSSLSNIQTDLVKMESKKEQLQENNRKQYDYMWDEYEITYQAAKQFERLELKKDTMQQEERNIKNDIKNMGHVNVSAIDEYEQIQERHKFLTSQRNDIVEAEEKLLVIIQELTKNMESQFIDRFKQIAENFNNVFAEMFGGGQAHLVLSENTNVLESGIEIIAEPPGKTLKNMMLLSGGERALTAIALLFAILKMKPSPFCILDEIEAALDDSNVERFANYLKNFSDNTQFILITHRKGTMEAADAIYGVTMQEQGVSKLVSVKFSK